MNYAIIIKILLCITQILAEKETDRTARDFRSIPNIALTANTYPSYNIPNIHGPGTYAFGYEVQDRDTGNLQFRDEEKLGDGTVRGAYGVLLPNGEVIITRYVADEMGYRTKIENHNLNQIAQNMNLLGQNDPVISPYSVQLPSFSNNQLQIQTDSSSNNGVFGWFGSLGQNIQNAFRPPPQSEGNPPNSGPLATLFRPITNLFNGNPNQNNQNGNQGGLFGIFPFLGGGNNPNNNNNVNYNNVEQFSPVQAEPLPSVVPSVSVGTQTNNNNDYWDYDIPIIRPLAVNSYKPQVVPGYDTTHNSYSNLLRYPVMTGPNMIPGPNLIAIPTQMGPTTVNEDGWFKKMLKRRRLQQQLKKEAKKEIKAVNKKIMQSVATNT